VDHGVIIFEMEKLLIFQINDKHSSSLNGNPHRNLHHRQDSPQKLKTGLSQTHKESAECDGSPQICQKNSNKKVNAGGSQH